jgi:hypothetical protein
MGSVIDRKRTTTETKYRLEAEAMPDWDVRSKDATQLRLPYLVKNNARPLYKSIGI